jgi:hypothetical protein
MLHDPPRTGARFLAASALALFGCDNQPFEPTAGTWDRLPTTLASAGLSAPSNTNAVLSGSGLDISWQDNSSDETKFEVYRSTASTGSFALRATTSPQVTHYSDQGLDGSQYCYKVRAARMTGSRTNYSAFSNTACATALPAAPSNVSAVPASETQIDVTWQDNSSYETSFEIYRSAYGETGTFDLLVRKGANTVAYSDGSLLSARRYCYQIRAYQLTGNSVTYSAFSNIACATTPAPSNPPAAVSDVKAKPKDSHTISVSWTDNATNEEGFRIYRSTDGGAVWNLAGTAGANQWGFEDSGRPSEQLVWYRVMAFNAGGEAPSNIASTAPPAGPTNLTEQPVDAQTVELSWNDNSAVEDGYQVWLHYATWNCCPNGGACDAGVYEGASPIAELPANSRTYRYVPSGGTESCGFAAYGYFVMATKDGGSSDPSNEVPAL